jgi:hypothetical protein
MVALDTIISVWAGEMIGPWLGFNIYDKRRKSMEFQYRTAQLIALGFNLYHNLRPMLTVYLAFTQIDILAVRIIMDLVTSVNTIHAYIKDKTVEADTDENADNTDADDSVTSGEDGVPLVAVVVE